MTMTKYQRVMKRADPYRAGIIGEAYAADSGHAWDRLHAIASEFERGDRDWASAMALVADTQASVVSTYQIARLRSTIERMTEGRVRPEASGPEDPRISAAENRRDFDHDDIDIARRAGLDRY